MFLFYLPLTAKGFMIAVGFRFAPGLCPVGFELELLNDPGPENVSFKLSSAKEPTNHFFVRFNMILWFSCQEKIYSRDRMHERWNYFQGVQIQHRLWWRCCDGNQLCVCTFNVILSVLVRWVSTVEFRMFIWVHRYIPSGTKQSLGHCMTYFFECHKTITVNVNWHRTDGIQWLFVSPVGILTWTHFLSL